MKTWREQAVLVEGRKFTFNDIHGQKLYHGSPYKISNGTTIVPQPDKKNFQESPEDLVCFTSDFNTAVYWARKALNDMTAQVYVYEIEPSEKIIVHRVMLANYGKNFNLQEGRSKTARILHLIPVPNV